MGLHCQYSGMMHNQTQSKLLDRGCMVTRAEFKGDGFEAYASVAQLGMMLEAFKIGGKSGCIVHLMFNGELEFTPCGGSSTMNTYHTDGKGYKRLLNGVRSGKISVRDLFLGMVPSLMRDIAEHEAVKGSALFEDRFAPSEAREIVGKLAAALKDARLSSYSQTDTRNIWQKIGLLRREDWSQF